MFSAFLDVTGMDVLMLNNSDFPSTDSFVRRDSLNHAMPQHTKKISNQLHEPVKNESL